MFVLQLAALGQQDQLGGRIALRADAIGERDERLHRAGDVGQRRDQIALRVLDALADLDFLVRLQQLALADVLQVDADEVDILARDAGLGRAARRLRVPRPSSAAAIGWSANASGSSSWSRRSGSHEWLTVVGIVAAVDVEAEVLRALTPVEHVRLPRRVVPLDERLARGRPRRPGRNGKGIGARRFFAIRVCGCKRVARRPYRIDEGLDPWFRPEVKRRAGRRGRREARGRGRRRRGLLQTDGPAD